MRYVVVGNGVAGIAAAFTVRDREPRASITVISGESDYFFARTALMYAFLDRLSRRDLEPYERQEYDRRKIRRVRGWVRDLDAGRKTLRLDSGAEIGYDRLLLATGSRGIRAPWPGVESVREGVANFVSLADLAACERLAMGAKRAVVAGGGLIGVELAECLRHHGLAVTMLVREDWYWPAALAPGEGALIADHLRRHGVDVRLGEEVAEVGAGPDGRLAWIRTSTSRIDCEMLGVAVGVEPAVGWLRALATPPRLGRGVLVDAGLRTSLDDVWAAGDCAEIVRDGREPLLEQMWYSAKRQGEIAGRAMTGQDAHYQPPRFYNSTKFFEIEYTAVGELRVDESFFYRYPDRDVSVRIAARGGEAAGFSLLGSRWNHQVLERWLDERRSLDDVVGRLDQAQFDGEFSRLDLRPLRAAYAGGRR